MLLAADCDAGRAAWQHWNATCERRRLSPLWAQMLPWLMMRTGQQAMQVGH